MISNDRITLTDSQLKQLRDFLEEKDHSGSIALTDSPNLGGGYVEPVLLDAEGEPTSDKRANGESLEAHSSWLIRADA